jgi:hypothetical protein
MTRKADRAKNIRQLTKTDIDQMVSRGVLVDESVPQGLASVLGKYFPDLDQAPVIAFLGVRLGEYRASVSFSNQGASVADEVRIADETIETIEELCKRLNNLPDRFEIALTETLRKDRGKDWDDVQTRLCEDLKILLTAMVRAQSTIETQKGKSGAKPLTARDALIRAVVAEVRKILPALAKMTRITMISHELLQQCVDDLPELPEFRKIVKKLENNSPLMN